MHRTGLILALLGLLTHTAHADVELTLGSRLGGGHNSNIYFDAAVLPAEGEEVAAPLLFVAPRVQAEVGESHLLTVSWEGQWSEFVGERESMLTHQATLGYTSAPVGGFRFGVVAAMHQLYVREAEGMGWIGGWGALQISRSLGYAVRGALSYTSDYDHYASGAAALWELAHRGSLSLTFRLARGLTASPGYTFSYVQAEPDELSSLQHLPSASLRWDVPWIPLDLSAGYGVTVLTLIKRTPTTGGGRGTRRSDLLHGIRAEATLSLTRWLDLFVRYDGTLGTSNQEPTSYARHQVLGGLAVRWADRLGSSPGRSPRERRVRLEIEAPEAKKVAAVGPFNDWSPSHTPLEREGQVWRKDLQLTPGRHVIMLWVDGELRPPEGCPNLVPDGFGGVSCVITVD